MVEPKFSYLGKSLLINNVDYLEYSSVDSFLEIINLNNKNNLVDIVASRNKLKHLYIKNNIWVNSFKN